MVRRYSRGVYRRTTLQSRYEWRVCDLQRPTSPRICPTRRSPAGLTEDKEDLSAHVQRSGAGIDLRVNRATPQAIKHAVDEIYTQPRYRERAHRSRSSSPAMTSKPNCSASSRSASLHARHGPCMKLSRNLSIRLVGTCASFLALRLSRWWFASRTGAAP
jgi:hypothetical protein